MDSITTDSTRRQARCARRRASSCKRLFTVKEFQIAPATIWRRQGCSDIFLTHRDQLSGVLRHPVQLSNVHIIIHSFIHSFMFIRTNSMQNVNRITHLISSHLTLSQLTSFHLNRVRRDWSQLRRTGSCAVITAHSVEMR